jgi:hypothetical protein
MNPPTDLRTRTFAALCDDMFDLGAGKATSFQRVDALREISRMEAAQQGPERGNQTRSGAIK